MHHSPAAQRISACRVGRPWRRVQQRTCHDEQALSIRSPSIPRGWVEPFPTGRSWIGKGRL